MRILLLAPHPFFQHRGTPIAEKALLEFLTADGHEVDVLTYHEGEEVDLPGCRIFRIPRLPGIRNLRPGFSLKKVLCDLVLTGSAASLLRKNRYDLVHAVEESVFAAAVLGKVFRIPYVYDMDSSLAEQMIERFPALRVAGPALRFSERHAIRRSRGVLAVCRSVEDVAREYDPGQLIARVEDSTLLRDGFEAARSASAERVVMYVGNLEKYQGIDLLLEGFALAASRLPDATLHIVGGQASSIAEYEDRARSLGIHSRVRWIGPQPVERLGEWLAQADVLVSPRLSGRNTPMKIYSYLDSGRPVVATRIATHTQVLDDEIAYLVDPNASSLGEALVQLLEDPARRARLGQRARERVQALYTPAAARQKLRAFYAAVEASLRNGDPAA